MKVFTTISTLLFSLIIFSCGTPSVYPIDNPSAKTKDNRIIGKWKYENDTNKANFYAISKSVDPYKYHVKFWNRGGTNPTYEANIYFSKIGKTKFINVPYWEKTSQTGDDFKDWTNRGYFFLRILKINKDFTRITTATVNDEKIKAIKSKAELRRYLSKNINNPNICSDTASFYKLK